jgi:hypothetical protein
MRQQHVDGTGLLQGYGLSRMVNSFRCILSFDSRGLILQSAWPQNNPTSQEYMRSRDAEAPALLDLPKQWQKVAQYRRFI